MVQPAITKKRNKKKFILLFDIKFFSKSVAVTETVAKELAYSGWSVSIKDCDLKRLDT